MFARRKLFSSNTFVANSAVFFRNLSILKEDQMASPKRYFVNNLADFTGKPLDVNVTSWKPFILDKVGICLKNQPATARNFDGGLYVGVAGLAYMCWALSQSHSFIVEKDTLLSQAAEIIRFCEDSATKSRRREKTDESGFLLGNAGIYAVAAAVYNSTGDEKGVSRNLKKFIGAAEICTPPKFVSFGGDEFLVGRAGYIAGALWLNKVFADKVIPEQKLNDVCKSIIDYGRYYSKKYNSPCPLMYSYYDTEYLGAAHGLCSILQMVLSCDTFLDSRPDAEKDVKECVDFLVSLQTPNGNFPCALDEVGRTVRPEADELVHWCHGAPGTVYLMVKAYKKWGDRKYLDSALKCGEVTWKKGLLKKGPGICHGVAGSGYVFLQLYQLTGDEKQLYRAAKFASFLVSEEFKRARVPDSPYSLYEGWAGTVIFLNDLLNPSTASFPFMEV